MKNKGTKEYHEQYLSWLIWFSVLLLVGFIILKTTKSASPVVAILYVVMAYFIARCLSARRRCFSNESIPSPSPAQQLDTSLETVEKQPGE